MKRVIVLLVMLSLLVTLAVPVLAAESGSSGSGDSQVLRGDVNHDGKINVLDVLMFKKIVSTRKLPPDPGPNLPDPALDLNGDDAANAIDYLFLKRMVQSLDF